MSDRKPTTVYLTLDLVDEIAVRIPFRQKSAWIEDVLRQALQLPPLPRGRNQEQKEEACPQS